MTLTVKLDPDLEQTLARRSAERGVPKSTVVKEALVEYLAREPVSAYEAGRDLFGRHGSGDGKLSARRREEYAAIAHAKQRRRR
ncbi:MAG: CopG family transcriptional regulator [Burkholderiales bacterium]